MRIIPYIALAICAIAIVGVIAANISQTEAADHLPAPQNVRAINSDQPGKVTVSWDPVPDARFYRIGWASLPAVEQAETDGRNWLDTFISIDIHNNGQTAHDIHGLAGATTYAFVTGAATERYGKAVWSEWAYTKTLSQSPFIPPGGCRSDPPPPPTNPRPPTPTEQPVAGVRSSPQHRHTTP